VEAPHFDGEAEDDKNVLGVPAIKNVNGALKGKHRVVDNICTIY
jgi:hypothetical protein